MVYNQLVTLLGSKADSLLTYCCEIISKDQLHLPSPSFVDEVFFPSNRNPQVLRSLVSIFGHRRLANTGYLSLLPVDQGIEHTAGASFAPNPCYFDSENILKLAIEGSYNAIATTFGILATIANMPIKIPFIFKIKITSCLLILISTTKDNLAQ